MCGKPKLTADSAIFKSATRGRSEVNEHKGHVSDQTQLLTDDHIGQRLTISDGCPERSF